MKIQFVIPIFNDWASFHHLVRDIDRVLAPRDCTVSILAIDDGSSCSDTGTWPSETFKRVARVEIVRLECNLGHQKAIAVGLAVAANRAEADMVVVMDGDGEDDPAELPVLLDSLAEGKSPIVLAHRSKRSEGRVFRLFYLLYKGIFRRLTGVSLSFGNFCALAPEAVRRLSFMPNLWNSLPATCLRSKLAISAVPTVRGSRYEGEPKMNFVSLVLHGLQAITVFSDTVLVRLSLGASAVALFSAALVVAVRLLVFDWVVPGWASNMIGFLVLSLLTVLFGLLTTSLLTLQERSNMPMIPYRDAGIFVRTVEKVLG
jgi:hypothetical protein